MTAKNIAKTGKWLKLAYFMKESANTRCSVCRGKHADYRDEINQMLAKGESRETIAQKTGVPARTIGNHAEHLGELITEAKEKEILGQVIDVGKEFAEQLEFVKKMRAAAEAWLTDPSNPERFTLDCRSNEIDVVYLDYNNLDENGFPRRKKESLQSLLDRLDEKKFSAVSWSSKHADNRDIALKTIDRCDATLSQFAKLGALYPKPQDTELLERIAILEELIRIRNEH